MGPLTVRALRPEDREAIHGMLRGGDAFTAEEVRVALEVLDEGLRGGADGDYPAFAAVRDGQVLGYVCIGKTPLTRGTWHEYWICVCQAAQHQGVGQKLQAYAEEFVRSRGGERLVLETSGRRAYARTRRFYRQSGFRVVGRIRNFYHPGDDCVVFCKELA